MNTLSPLVYSLTCHGDKCDQNALKSELNVLRLFSYCVCTEKNVNLPWPSIVSVEGDGDDHDDSDDCGQPERR